MSKSPKVLKDKEVEWVSLQRVARIPSARIMKLEPRYSLSELKDMARTAGISPIGTKDQLLRSLVRVGAIG